MGTITYKGVFFYRKLILKVYSPLLNEILIACDNDDSNFFQNKLI